MAGRVRTERRLALWCLMAGWVALVSGCTIGPTSPSVPDPSAEPGSGGAARPYAEGRRGPPVYRGCYVSFDRPTAAPPAGGGRPEDGRLELRWRLDRTSEGPFRTVEIEPIDCAGAGFGPSRDTGWRAIPAQTDPIRLRLGGAAETVAEGELPPARYDHVFVAADIARAIPTSGPPAKLHTHVEPIARGFDLSPGQHLVVDIVLTVQERPRVMGGGWSLFVKDALMVESAGRKPVTRLSGHGVGPILRGIPAP